MLTLVPTLGLRITLVVVSDPDPGRNQLIDIVALTPVLVAGLWCRVRSQRPPGDVAAPIIAMIIVWIGASTYMLDMRPEVVEAMEAAARMETRSEVERLRQQLPPDPRVLSEDPAVPVMLGQVPTVLDPWMLLRLGEREPSWIEDLAERIEAREFDAVLLLYTLQDRRHGVVVVHRNCRTYGRRPSACSRRVDGSRGLREPGRGLPRSL
jgi:hypothetical protein